MAAPMTASGIWYTGKCVLYGFMLGMDGTNDATVTILDGTTTSGEEKIPTNTYDASALGMNGVIMPEGASIPCTSGIYVIISCAGTCEVVPLVRGTL